MDSTLMSSLLLAMFISAISTQLPAKEKMSAHGNDIVETKATSLASSSSDVSKITLNKEGGGIVPGLKSITGITTPSTVTKVNKSSGRRSVRRSRRRLSRRSSRRRKRTKPSSRSSARATKQTSNRSKPARNPVTKTNSNKTLETSDTATKITTISPVKSSMQPGHESTRTTQIHDKSTKLPTQETKESPETLKMTFGEPEITTKSVTSKSTKHRFIETAKEKNGKTFPNATNETENDTISTAPYKKEARTVVKGDSQSDGIPLEKYNSHKSIGESDGKSGTKASNKQSSITDEKGQFSIQAITVSNQPHKLVKSNENGTDSSAASHTLGRNITSSTSIPLPIQMANMTETSKIKNVEKTPAGDVVHSPALQQPPQKTTTSVHRQNHVPIASVLARVLPYLAGMLGSSRVIVRRIGPDTILRGSEGSFPNPTVQRLPGRRRVSTQAIPVQLHFAVPPLLLGNRGQSRVSFLNLNRMGIYRQLVLCSETPNRLRKTCIDNLGCQYKMECYSGKCCATSEDHAERLDNMLDHIDRRRPRRFRIRH